MGITNAGGHEVLLGFIGGIGIWEIGLILLVVLLLFGGKKIPELAKGLGSGIKEFKKAAREVSAVGSDLKAAVTDEPPAPPSDAPIDK